MLLLTLVIEASINLIPKYCTPVLKITENLGFFNNGNGSGKMFLRKLVIFGVLFIFLVGPCSAVTVNHVTATKTNINLGKATIIAKLNIAAYGFGEDIPIDSVLLTTDRKYWIIKAHTCDKHLEVTVNAKDGSSKLNKNSLKSFSEIKACYVAALNYPDTGKIEGKPFIVTIECKKVWKVPICVGMKKHYVYFDSKNGKSKINNGKWKTLKEVDDEISKRGYPIKFRDLLRDLYPQ